MYNQILKPCPFCGGNASVLVESDKFQIVGCSHESMLCPNPKLVVYKTANKWDYKYWNRRLCTKT